MQSVYAFDVSAERVQTDYNQEQLPPAQRGMPSRRRVTAAYKVTITNAKSEAVTVDVRESRYGVWRVVGRSGSPEKLSATAQRFPITPPAARVAAPTLS